jgi:hypothetical protein
LEGNNKQIDIRALREVVCHDIAEILAGKESYARLVHGVSDVTFKVIPMSEKCGMKRSDNNIAIEAAEVKARQGLNGTIRV